MKLTIREVLESTGGTLVAGSPDAKVGGVSTDSRTVRPGDLFFALRGERHDGHRYLSEVFQKGAAAAVVGEQTVEGKNLIRVPDTLRALGDLAGAWRRRFPIRVVAVTGSNGKTTTKDMTASILETSFRVMKTEGNFNNLIGLPLTLFRLEEDRRPDVAVLEMGMNRPGEIDRLAEIASPEVGVITNVARAHLEGLGTIRRIAAAKAELLRRLPRQGTAVLNADDPSFPLLQRASRSSLMTFGKRRGAAVRLLSFRAKGLQGIEFKVSLRGKKVFFKSPILGRQNVSNALAALAVAELYGVPFTLMKKALASFQTGSRRLERLRLSRGIDLVNDCYNANPDSMAASLHLLKEISGRRRVVAVLGEMLELGANARKYHREVGREAGRAGVKLLFAVGPHSKEVLQGARRAGVASAFAFESLEEAIPSIRSALLPGDLVLVKGSRGMQMERVTEELKNAL